MKSPLLHILLFLIPVLGFSARFTERDGVIIGHYEVAEFKEKLTALTPSVLQEKSYSLHEEDVLLLKSFDGAYVIKFELINTQSDTDISVHINQPLLDRAELYVLKNGTYEKVLTFGDAVPYSTRKYQSVTGIYNFSALRGDTIHFVLVTETTENLRVPIFGGPKSTITNKIWNENYFFGVFAGILIAMFLYNFFIGISTRSRSYLLYSAYLLFVFLTQASLQGFSHKYLWPEFSWLALRSSVFFPALAGVTGIYFMIEFLQLREKKPRFVKLALGYVIGYFISVTVSVLGYKILGYNLVSVVAGTQSFHMIAVLISLVYKGDRASKFFLVSWCAFLIGLLLFLIKDIGLLNYNWVTAHSMPLGVVIETVLLSFALADTFNKLKEENEKSKLRELQLSKEKTEILSQQNEKLEVEVQLRTQDILTQKNLLEIKNKEVTDSIIYAKRLQTAIQPNLGMLSKFFNESFLFYRPKDIVSGDFYWSKAVGDNLYVVIADCTGHGVPGAMVSVIGITGLERCITEYHLTETNEILDKLSTLVIETFEDENIQDGMDIGIIKWNKSTNKISYSGANHNLWVISKQEYNDLKKFELEELELGSEYSCYTANGNRQPIGKYFNKKPFKKIEFQLAKGDKFYMLTDGLIDQFGGEHGKKFRTINFIKFAYTWIGEPMQIQKDELEKELERWKGELEQVDDITVFGAQC